jgi:hypothetical protein
MPIWRPLFGLAALPWNGPAAARTNMQTPAESSIPTPKCPTCDVKMHLSVLVPRDDCGGNGDLPWAPPAPRGSVPYPDPEKRREFQRKWRAANREKIREASQKWRNANLDKARQSTRAYREANREKVRERQRKYDAAKRARAQELVDPEATG